MTPSDSDLSQNFSTRRMMQYASPSIYQNAHGWLAQVPPLSGVRTSGGQGLARAWTHHQDQGKQVSCEFDAIVFIIYIRLYGCVHSLPMSHRRSSPSTREMFLIHTRDPNASNFCPRARRLQLLLVHGPLVAYENISVIVQNNHRGEVLPAASLNLYP
jgi:hypothetical protein